MNFIDKVDITVKAGDGGNGVTSFRREKFISRGGPDGGDGGNGGDIVFKASNNENTLVAFRNNPKIHAQSGESGSKRKKHGRSGEDKIVNVPTGTVVNNDKNETVIDLTEDGQTAVVARGGIGGFGNAHFVSSIRQAPRFAEIGEKTDPIKLTLELKMIADVGIVGLPNAGKSTLLATLSNAKPAIADYPFTTLTPNLGVVDVDQEISLLLADIPGLIEGASQGKGLGIQFLRHIERTLVLVHLIDVYSENLIQDYKTVQNELKAYQVNLSNRPQLVVLTKIEGLDQTTLTSKLNELKTVIPKNTPALAISSVSGLGAREFLTKLKTTVIKARNRQEKLIQAKKDQKPILRLANEADRWKVTKNKGTFLVSGQRIERFASRSDFSNDQSIQRLRDIMQKIGISHELVRLGIKTDDTIQISKYGSFKY